VIPEGDQVALRSSHCLDGCGFDRHAEGDERFIRRDGAEGVVFEERGPGAIVRIWMTAGESGMSVPLDPATSIRFYFDGETTPRIDVPLPALFDASTPPFVPPLVGDRLASSGGNFSYVPIPFAQSCRVALAGDLTQRLWFQFGFHRLPPDAVVPTYTGREDLDGLIELLAAAGDPWPDGGGVTTEGTVILEPGMPEVLWVDSAAGTITELGLHLPRPRWPRVRATLTFDGITTVDLPVDALFAAGAAAPVQALWLRADTAGDLTSFLPMPYWRRATLALTLDQGAAPVAVAYRVRSLPGEPLPGSGLFAAELAVANPSTIGSDHLFLDRAHAGKWIGLYAELGSVATPARQYLEGDERVFVDGLRHPTLYGTGAEDFFNGGFYFDQGPFGLPLHGVLELGTDENGEHRTAAYRFLLTDAVPFARSLLAGLEGGREADLAIRARTVAWFYADPRPALAVVDALDVGDPRSRISHGYSVRGFEEIRELDGLFEGHPPAALAADGGYRGVGAAEFWMAAAGCAGDRRLRRLWDAGVEGQRFDLRVDGSEAGGSEFTLGNAARRWAESDFGLPAIARGGEALFFEVAARPAGGGVEHTDFAYELLCRLPGGALFADGFESGDTAGWSSTIPRGDSALDRPAGPGRRPPRLLELQNEQKN